MVANPARRTFLSCGCLVGAAAALSCLPAVPAAWAAESRTDLTPDAALAKLKQGNELFVADKPLSITTQDHNRRLDIARGQTPFCVLVGCSDSRVSPEILFGRGLGELFIVRNAGNTVDTAALGSIEYAISQLGVPLILVMGHSRCGAVQAAVDVVKNNTLYPGSIGRMIEPIVPAVLTVRDTPGDMIENAVRANVDRVVTRLRRTESALNEPLKGGKLKVVGATYSLDSGIVDFFNEG